MDERGLVDEPLGELRDACKYMIAIVESEQHFPVLQKSDQACQRLVLVHFALKCRRDRRRDASRVIDTREIDAAQRALEMDDPRVDDGQRSKHLSRS